MERIAKFMKILGLIILVMSVFWRINAQAEELPETINITGVCYEMPAAKAYDYNSAYLVDSMSYGSRSAGTLSINGSINKETKKSGILAFGTTGNVSFSYNYNQNITNPKRKSWHIIEDREKKFLNRKLNGDIFNGVLIVQKSYDGVHYFDAVNPICNLFDIKKLDNFYTSSGEDISRGVYYRLTIAYKTTINDGRVLSKKMRHMEVYDIYIVENSGTISIHNLSVDERVLESEEYTQELLLHGETLVNGSVTRDGFLIEPFAQSYTVKVQKNGNEIASNQNKYTEDGKYTITTVTKLGDERQMTVYVFSGGDDKGYSTYFGDGPIQAERVFRQSNIPSYAKGGFISIKKTDVNVPPLYGSVIEKNTGKHIYEINGDREDQKYPLKPGEYIVSLFNGNENLAGSLYHYIFTFAVTDDDVSVPYVNHHILETREELQDLQSKHYEVAYQTTAGGFIFVCFDLESYEQALDYAREIEGRYVEPASDGGFYYKSEENPNLKVKYMDEIEMTRVRELYARKNVEINYFNPLDKFTYRTYSDDLLERLEDINTPESIKVFPSQEVKDRLIDRKPYLNGFTFIKAADYDVIGVTAQHNESREMIPITLEEPVDNQLNDTAEYKIIETNKYGHSSSYNATYVNECQTKLVLGITNKGAERTIRITSADIKDETPLFIKADSICVKDIDNEYDEWSIVTIKAPDVYSFELKCLTSEFKDLELDKAGEYHICFIDRMGNSYQINIELSGISSYANKQKSCLSYAELYNKLYLNNQDLREDYTALPVLLAEREAKEQAIRETEMNDSIDVESKPLDVINESNEDESRVQDNERVENHTTRNTVFVILIGMLFVSAFMVIKAKGDYQIKKGIQRTISINKKTEKKLSEASLDTVVKAEEGQDAEKNE